MAITAADQRLSILVAEEVRAWMGRRRMSGVALAIRIDRTQAYVSRRLTGEVAFDIDDLERIAAALDIEVTDLLPITALTERRRRMPTTAYALTRVIDRDRPQTSASRPSTYGASRRPSVDRPGMERQAVVRRRGAAI